MDVCEFGNCKEALPYSSGSPGKYCPEHAKVRKAQQKRHYKARNKNRPPMAGPQCCLDWQVARETLTCAYALSTERRELWIDVAPLALSAGKLRQMPARNLAKVT